MNIKITILNSTYNFQVKLDSCIIVFVNYLFSIQKSKFCYFYFRLIQLFGITPVEQCMDITTWKNNLKNQTWPTWNSNFSNWTFWPKFFEIWPMYSCLDEILRKNELFFEFGWKKCSSVFVCDYWKSYDFEIHRR